MKKFYTLFAVVATAFAANAQLNTNGSLENWADGTTAPEGWFINATQLSNGVVAKVSTGAQDGTNFVEITAPTSSYNSAGLADIAITGGESYTLTYYYKETVSGEARLRPWGQWRDANAAITPPAGDAFQPSTYIEDTNGQWTMATITSTAPANATILRFTFRVYPQNNAGGGKFGIDNVNLTTTASVAENNIEGLNVYPNPANDIVTISSFSLEPIQVSLFDMTGKQVLNTTTESTINVEFLNAGVYTMKINQDGKLATRKLVIK